MLLQNKLFRKKSETGFTLFFSKGASGNRFYCRYQPLVAGIWLAIVVVLLSGIFCVFDANAWDSASQPSDFSHAGLSQPLLHRSAQPFAIHARTLAETSGGPDDFGYVWEQEPFDWKDVMGQGHSVSYGDDIEIGFSFKFYENVYHRVFVSPYGFLSFQEDGLSRAQSTIPNPSKPNNVIAPRWAAGRPRSLKYIRGGAAPNRWLAIEWHRLRNDENEEEPPDEFTFQCILHENGDIVFQYGDMNIYGNHICESSGIENELGLDGLAVSHYCEPIESHHAVRIRRPAPDARVGLPRKYFSALAFSADTTVYHIPIYNYGDLGDDIYDVSLTSTWEASLFQSDDRRPLGDANGNGLPDTGPIPPGDKQEIIVKVRTPYSATTGDENSLQLTVRSSLNPSRQRIVRIRSVVPTSFVQAYQEDGFDYKVSLMYINPQMNFHRDVPLVAVYSANYLSISELPDQRFLYMWTEHRYLDRRTTTSEIKYAILGPQGEMLRPVTTLEDHSGATHSIKDVSPSPAVSSDGRVGVIWVRNISVNGKENENIYFAVLDQDANLEYGPVRITNNDKWGAFAENYIPRFSNTRIVATNDKRFVLGWIQSYSFEPNEHCKRFCKVGNVWVAVRGIGGNEIHSPIRLTNDSPDVASKNDFLSATNVNGDGTLLVFRNATEQDLVYIVIDSKGNIVRERTNLSGDGEERREFGSDAIQLDDGGIVVAWMGERDGINDMFFVTLDKDFHRMSEPQILPNPESVFGSGPPSVTRDHQNRAVITWPDYSFYNPSYNLYYALVRGNGEIISMPTVIDSAEISYSGYGNTTYSWKPPTNLNLHFYLPFVHP